jgi:hypothetical protein
MTVNRGALALAEAAGRDTYGAGPAPETNPRYAIRRRESKRPPDHTGEVDPLDMANETLRAKRQTYTTERHHPSLDYLLQVARIDILLSLLASINSPSLLCADYMLLGYMGTLFEFEADLERVDRVGTHETPVIHQKVVTTSSVLAEAIPKSRLCARLA